MPFEETVGLFKSISSNISATMELISACNIENNCEMPILQERCNELKRLVTGSPANAGYFIISAEHKISINTLNRAIKSQIYKTVIFINRLDHM